ncbi:MAG TPA: carboxymuconolactone decarboxylase family protein [Trebonia sp.]|jgi:alkylhydroperoxidase family enzyme|nr:carboxymuconolactone decarboxylase family protein [Trebonia sp.]
MRPKLPSRIPFEEMTPQLQELLTPRRERLGYVGEFFQVGAHQPQALEWFVRFTEELKEQLDWRLAEVIALTVAAQTGNDYERIQHERLALRLGFDGAQIRAVVDGSLERLDSFSEAEITAAKLAAGMVHSHGRACEAESRRLLALLGESGVVTCTMLAARYLAHAAMANTWMLEVPVPSLLPER